MSKAITETFRRREIQEAYNKKNKIIPKSSGKKANNSLLSFLELSRRLQQDGSNSNLIEIATKATNSLITEDDSGLALEALPELINSLEEKMKTAAKELNFEDAAKLRDRIKKLRYKLLGPKSR